MASKNAKNSGIKFKHGNDKFGAEAAEELGIPVSNNSNFTTAKILYAYELGLNDRL